MDSILNFSLNIDFLDRAIKSDLSEYENKFKNVSGSLQEMAEAIKDGEAFSYQYYNEERKTVNFLCSDFLVIDINDGRTITQVLEHQLVRNFYSLLYTTVNHTPDKHRFRLIFVLPRTIKHVKELKAATKSLARRLGGDMTTTDGARMFYGCKNGYQQITNNKISHELLEDLLADGITSADNDSITNKSTINISKLTLKPYFQIKTIKGVLVKFGDFKQKTNVYCPYHHDESAVAFVGLNVESVPYLFCAYCQSTRWLEGFKSKFDFDSFENTVREYLENPPAALTKQISPLIQYLYDEVPLKNEQIHFANDKHLKIPKVEKGITFIKSPKGSGKTHFLKTYLDEIILKPDDVSINLESFALNKNQEFKTKIYTDKKVLLIGHRQALISEMCERLGLICYLEVKNTSELAKGNNPNYGVCLDSLCSAIGKDTKWDLIIIDESEQVLSHFLSETLGEKRIEIFHQLDQLISNAKSVITLDADLGWITFNTITRMVKPKTDYITPIQIYINKWQADQEPIFVYPTATELIEHMKQSIVDGKQVFVTSNSKSKIQSLEKSIEELASALKIPIPMITVTSENSKTALSQNFIKNIKTEIKRYKVILSSPSLGTGIDITFDENIKVIDCVYGIFENRINTHFEIDQQLRRVRHPKEVHVWVSPTWHDFETEFEVVKEEYLNNNFLFNLYYKQGLESGSLNRSNKFVSNFLMMATLITVQQRSSKNALKSNFVNFKKSEGYKIIEVAYDEFSMKAGQAFYNSGKDILSEQNIEELLNSKPVSKEDYEATLEKMDSNDKQVTRAEYFSYKRAILELFYRQKITRQMIVDDEKYKLRKGITAYEYVTDAERIKAILHGKSNSHLNLQEAGLYEKILPNKGSAALLLCDLFKKTPIFHNNNFQPWIEYKSADLTDFIKQMIKHKRFIENHLGLSIRSDINAKPAQQLGKVLKEVGLGHWKAKTRIIEGKKVYFYTLSRDKLIAAEIIVNRRRKFEDIWKFYNELHGFKNESDAEFFD